MNENQKSTPRDVFLYLLLAATLYFSIVNILILLFSYIDILFKDVLSYGNPSGAIRWGLASVIIVFPVHLWLARYLRKEMAAAPEKREIKVRKWIINLTLFLAALIIIGDLVAVVYRFLDGELAASFYLKILATLLTAGAVFWYYLNNLRQETGTFNFWADRFGIIAGAAVLAIVVAGFFLGGSPFAQRLARYDEQKVSDLQMIQGQIVNYWSLKGEIPENLGQLRDNISGWNAPVDKQTQAPYEYRKTGDLSFELCAVFNADSDSRSMAYYDTYPFRDGNWNHGKGRTCFDRTIDPELYPSRKPLPAP